MAVKPGILPKKRLKLSVFRKWHRPDSPSLNWLKLNQFRRGLPVPPLFYGGLIKARLRHRLLALGVAVPPAVHPPRA